MKQKLRKQFLTLLIALLQNGFSIQESLQVIQRTGQFPAGPLENFTSNLQNGLPIGTCFEAIGFNQEQVLQINLADSHGDLPYTLATILQHMELFEKQKKEIQKVASYVLSLQGTNPAGGKAPEGDVWNEDGAAKPATADVVVTDTIAKK